MNSNLPFPRGGTYFGGSVPTGSTYASVADIVGQKFTVRADGQGDLPVYMDNQGTPVAISRTAGDLELVVCRNGDTTTLLAPAGVLFNGINPYEAKDYTGAADYGLLIDDAHNSAIAVGDLFYCVASGPCIATHTAGGSPIQGGVTVQFGSTPGEVTTGVTTPALHNIGRVLGDIEVAAGGPLLVMCGDYAGAGEQALTV